MTREEALKSFKDENIDFERTFEKYGYQMSPEEVSAVKETIERNKVAISALSDREKGEWIEVIDEKTETSKTWHYECSKCGKQNNCCGDNPNFCPNCGADMRGEADE